MECVKCRALSAAFSTTAQRSRATSVRCRWKNKKEHVSKCCTSAAKLQTTVTTRVTTTVTQTAATTQTMRRTRLWLKVMSRLVAVKVMMTLIFFFFYSSVKSITSICAEEEEETTGFFSSSLSVLARFGSGRSTSGARTLLCAGFTNLM